MQASNQEPIWAYLLHLGYNMWCDRDVPGLNVPYHTATSSLRCETAVWEELLPRLADAGINMLVVDIGEGIRYDSHPELAIEGSWDKARLADSIGKMRQLGLEPIPKLNFSTCHDAWLGPYSRMVSTPAYYQVCADLIDEVVDLFDTPRFFHLGMDEENIENHVNYEYVVIRQYDLWWHDVQFFVDQVTARGVRGWVWSDYIWDNRQVFLDRMPRSVVQSNWYYGSDFTAQNVSVDAYSVLDAAGFDQIPAGSNWACETNFVDTVRHCRKAIASEHLLGFFQTVWKPTMADTRDIHLRAIAEVARARSL